MLDPKIIREKPSLVKESLKKRGKDTKIVDNFLELDKQLIDLKKETDDLRHERNVVSQRINELKKEKKEAEAQAQIKKAKEIPEKIKEIETKLGAFEKERNDLLLRIPNLLEKEVPFGVEDRDNKIIKTVGKIPRLLFKTKDHQELGEALDLFDVKKAAEVSGARFYYLKNEAVLLDMALQRYAIDILVKNKYKPIMTPAMAREKILEGTGFFPAYKDDTYKVQDEDLYLLGTSEKAIAALHMDETLKEKDLPIRYVGFSPCYRPEAGTHGKDSKGIFRVHQFNKVEQFVFCTPQQEQKEFKFILEMAEKIVKGLGLPYRVVNTCGGNVPTSTSKMYDIEAWFPGQNAYREIGSCSTCTDYQARGLKIKYFDKKGQINYIYTLNNTALAIERVLIAILENFQQKDGSIKIPRVLQKYCGFSVIKSKEVKGSKVEGKKKVKSKPKPLTKKKK